MNKKHDKNRALSRLNLRLCNYVRALPCIKILFTFRSLRRNVHTKYVG